MHGGVPLSMPVCSPAYVLATSTDRVPSCTAAFTGGRHLSMADISVAGKFAVGSQVGHLKTVIILAGGFLLFEEPMPLKKLAGIVLGMSGIIWCGT